MSSVNYYRKLVADLSLSGIAGVRNSVPNEDEEPAKVFVADPKQMDALNRLHSLADQLQLDEVLDGPALLALTTAKLDLLLSRIRPDPPPEPAAAMMKLIKDNVGPLRLAYDKEQPRFVSGMRVVPEVLVPVERVLEQASLLVNMVEWEDIKESPKATVHSRANVTVCCNFSGTGKSTAADRAADPSDADLEELARRLPKGACRDGAFAKALACLRITVNMSDLLRKGVLQGARTAEAAVAKLVWKAIQNDVRLQLRLHLEATGSFLHVQPLLEAVRQVLGSKLQLLLHIDDLQAVRQHGESGGWFERYVEPFNEVVSPVAKVNGAEPRTDAVAARSAFLAEMAAVYGLWHIMEPVIRMPGHFVFLTGRTMVPFLMGQNYVGVAQLNEWSPGHTCAHLLPPLSPAGILETAARTRCKDGQSIVQALGFNQEDVDALEHREDVVRCMREAGVRGQLPRTESAVVKPEDRFGKTMQLGKRNRQDDGSATPEAAGEGSSGHGVHGGVRSTVNGPVGVVSPEERDAAEEPSSQPADFWLRHARNDLGDRARRLLLLILMVHWITCGIPLLVQIVLAEAVGGCLELYRWAERPMQELCEFFFDKDSPISEAILTNERSLKGLNKSGLTDVEKVQLVIEAVLGRPTTFQTHTVLQQAVMKASIYTKPTEAFGEAFELGSPIKSQRVRLSVVPLMPPPMVRLFSAVHSGAAILAEAVQREPSLVEPGRALEFISRSGLVNLLMRSAIRPTLLKDFLPLLKKWQPAAGAFICGTRRACQPIPGVKVQRGRRLPEQPSSDDLQTLKKRPWSAQLAEEEAQYQMTCMGEAAIGCPHPTSAGPDIIFQAGAGKSRTMVLFQCKLRTGKDRLGISSVISEASRAARHLAEWKKQQNLSAACLVYLIVGHSMTHEVEALMGQWLPAGTGLAGKGFVPKGIDLIIPDAGQVSELLGKDAIEALISLQVNPEGTPASAMEKLAEMLTSASC